MMVFVSISGSKSTDNLLKEKSPKITIATNTRAVDTGFLTAVPYKLIVCYSFSNILPFAKSVYSKDALLGIYVPGNPKSEITKDDAGGALDGLPTSGIPGVDAAAQVATVVASSAANAGKQALSKNVKKIKVTIKTNYEVYLRPEEK